LTVVGRCVSQMSSNHRLMYRATQESETGIVECPEENPIVIRAMLEFIYTGQYTWALDQKMEDFTIRVVILGGELCLAAKKYNLEGLFDLAKSRMKCTATQDL